MTRIVVKDRGSGITDHELCVALAAMQRGIDEELARTWHVSGSLVLESRAGEIHVDDWTLTLADDPDADDLGHHRYTNGVPNMVVFPPFAAAQGIEWTVPCFHEIAETLVDPRLGLWKKLPDGRILACEICDPVQGDTFPVDGVILCDFVTPAYYDGGEGPFDIAGALGAPGEVRPGGYVQQLTAGKWQRIEGAMTAPVGTPQRWSRGKRRTSVPSIIDGVPPVSSP